MNSSILFTQTQSGKYGAVVVVAVLVVVVIMVVVVVVVHSHIEKSAPQSERKHD